MMREDAFCAKCDDVRPVGENGCVSCWALRPPVYTDEQRAALVEQVRVGMAISRALAGEYGKRAVLNDERKHRCYRCYRLSRVAMWLAVFDRASLPAAAAVIGVDSDRVGARWREQFPGRRANTGIRAAHYALDRGVGPRDAARLFGVHEETVRRQRKRIREGRIA